LKYATTRATIDKAIAELEKEGYLTSHVGSGTYVATITHGDAQNIQTWGVIVPNVMEEIYPGLVRGVENYAHEVGINIILCNSDNDPEKQEMYIRRLVASGVSGIILVPIVSSALKEVYRLYSQLIDTHIPFVFCNRSIDGINVPVIASNDFYGGYIATKHLLEQGYKRPAYIAKIKYKTSSDRCQGYLSALLEAGMDINRNAILFDVADNDHTGIMNLITKEKVDSIFCFDDSLAERCYRAVAQLEFSIPGDIGIIGYNNTSICESLTPRLTSVSFKNVEIGEKAAQVLMKIISHSQLSGFEYYLFQPAIEIRPSTQKAIPV
jgi:DNA-binding LacI/PurR family transcriptional regulator